VFFAISAATHILKMNCAKITKDRSEQPAYKIHSIECTSLTI